MTETEIKLDELQKNITHLTELSPEGWVLKWEDSIQPAFEIVCRKANVLQVEKLESLVDGAYEQAKLQLR